MARSNKIVVPDAKQSLDNFKMEVARSLNVNLNRATMAISRPGTRAPLAAKW